MLNKLDNCSALILAKFLKPTEFINLGLTCRNFWDEDVEEFYWMFWAKLVDTRNKNKKSIVESKSNNSIRYRLIKLLKDKICIECQLIYGRQTPLEIKLCGDCRTMPKYNLITKTDSKKFYFLPDQCVDEIDWIESDSPYGGSMYLGVEEEIINECIKHYGSAAIYNRIRDDEDFRKEYKKQERKKKAKEAKEVRDEKYAVEDKFLIKWLRRMEKVKYDKNTESENTKCDEHTSENSKDSKDSKDGKNSKDNKDNKFTTNNKDSKDSDTKNISFISSNAASVVNLSSSLPHTNLISSSGGESKELIEQKITSTPNKKRKCDNNENKNESEDEDKNENQVKKRKIQSGAKERKSKVNAKKLKIPRRPIEPRKKIISDVLNFIVDCKMGLVSIKKKINAAKFPEEMKLAYDKLLKEKIKLKERHKKEILELRSKKDFLRGLPVDLVFSKLIAEYDNSNQVPGLPTHMLDEFTNFYNFAKIDENKSMRSFDEWTKAKYRRPAKIKTPIQHISQFICKGKNCNNFGSSYCQNSMCGRCCDGCSRHPRRV